MEFHSIILVEFYNIIWILRVHELNTKLNFECQIHNTMIVLLKTNNLSLYLKCMLHKNVVITVNYIYSHFCWWKFHQNPTRIDFGRMFWKNVVLYEIYSKKWQRQNTFCTSLYINFLIFLEIYNNKQSDFCSNHIDLVIDEIPKFLIG